MIFEPIEIELEKPRRFKLNLRALMRAEREINRQRGAGVADYVAIDNLVLEGARQSMLRYFPLDLLAVLLWAGLNEIALDEKEQQIGVDAILGLIEASPWTRPRLAAAVVDCYLKITTKEPAKDESKDEGKEGEHPPPPLAGRPGSISGALQ
jgi:hypothetical protein